MDEEGHDGPFTVWQMFNAPTMVLFDNLENAADGLERLLNSIKLFGESDVLVPRPGSTKYPDAYYSAFNTWLLGRLFYVWSVKELNRIHTLSKDAQLKILHILSMNDASFYDKLHSEYFSILNKLIQCYNDAANNQPAEICLEHFSPEKVVIPNVELKLEPIYVQIKDLKTCKSMIDLTLQLLSQSITFKAIAMDQYKEEYKKVFEQVLYVLDNFSADLKLASLKFFADLFTNYEQINISKFHKIFPEIYEEMLKSFEAIVKSMHVYYEKGEVDKLDLETFKSLSLILMKFMEVNIEQEHREILTTICTVVLQTKSNDVFGKELKLYSLSMSSKIEQPEELMYIKKRDATEVNMLAECYYNNIISHIQSAIDNKRPVNLTENWYYNQLISVFQELRQHDTIYGDKVLFEYTLHKCRTVLRILYKVFVDGMKSNKKDYMYNSLLTKEMAKGIWTLQLRHVKLFKDELLQLQDILSTLLNLILDVIGLLDKSTLTVDQTNELLSLICLQTSGLSSFSSNFDQKTTAVILKHALVALTILKKNKVNEAWTRFVTLMFNNLTKVKNELMYLEVISMSGLLLTNKVLSASKLIGDILMPAFLTKNKDIQQLLTEQLPTISCIALGTYHVVLDSSGTQGHSIFKNGTLNVSIICSNCSTTKTNDGLTLHSETNATENQATTLGLRSLFSKFLNANQYVYLDSGYWEVVRRFCGHYYVFNGGVPKELVCEENCHHILEALKPLLGNQLDNTELQSHKEDAINLSVTLLVKSTRSCLEDNSYSRQTQTLNNIKEFGIHGNEKVILPVTKLLVYFIMHPQCSLGPKAVLYLREICEVHGYTPNQVYHRYKKDYCKLFVECSLFSGKEFTVSLLKVVRAFGFVGYRDFISKDVHHFLPYLMPYSVTVKQVPAMIEEIASLVQCSVADFLIDRFPHVYVHVYLNESKEVAQKCNSTIEKLTKTSTLSLIKKHFRIILTEFLLQYCSNPDKVLNACRYLACHDPDVSTPDGSMSMSTSQIADFLNPKFLGVLAYFDHKLVNAKVALSVKRKALKSFPDIMQLMGEKYLTPLRFKVLATLRSALPLAKEFPKILADAWGAFIHNIDSMSLGPLLTNLAVSLLQQLEHAPQEINKIFQYLVLSNENLLSSHIPELFFLEDTKLSEKIKMVVKRHVKRTQPESFLDKVKWYLNHLDQDIPRIKAYAFAQLDKLLKKNRTEIHKAIFGGKNIDSAIVELIDALLQGCKHPDPQVSAASGACLGQLGAIEAGHLPRQYVQPDRSPFAFSIGDNCFAATALMELARAFQYEKDTMNMDSYALTIQEILKIYDISPTGSKKDVWDSFPEHIHQIMFPLLSSRYTLAYPSQPKKAHPLFGSTFATTFLEWAHNWAGQLIPLIEPENIRELLRTVHPSMRRDVRTLFLFLPYVLLHAVMTNNNTQYIQEEILAVIGSESATTDSRITDKNRYTMLRDVRLTPNINTVQAEEGNQSKCSKTIYTLLDFLNRWMLEWCHSKQRPLENENYKAISMFMEKFDKLLIARGNFACGELERALQYLELYMGEKKQHLQEQLPLLAEIYALLDEPDSVAGILSIKRSEPSLNELILTQVVTGRLQDAALCYERLAQEGQLDRHSLRGMVDCYLGLDQPFTAYRLLSEHDTACSTAELAAEPLWRLGRFDQLDELINKPLPSSRENWGVLMGRILLAYRSQDTNLFQLSCKNATAKLLAQMDGEAKGESALRSGYQSVLGLHVITEAGRVEEVFQRVKSLNDGDRQAADVLNKLLEEWRRRLSVVQSDVRTVEPLLRLRRVLLQQTQELLEPTHPATAGVFKACIGDLWLQSAKHARKAGIFQQSYMYILNAEEYRPQELFIEKAKMYWARGQHEHAFTTLRRGLEEAFPQLDTLTSEQRKTCAKAKLLIAKYNDETTNVDVDVNIGYYKEAVDVFKQWEKSLVCLGAYYEKVSNSDATGSGSPNWSRRLYALNSYGKALQYGHKYLYQSMPRMLSIWLDVEVTSSDTSIHSVLAQMTEVIKTYSERLPLYLYLTAFSQIVSRICHPVKEVYLQLKAIIVKLILAYPQHTLWMMLSVLKSAYPQRIKRCSDVFLEPRLKQPHMLKLLADFTRLAEQLIELCNKPIQGSTTTVSALVRTLPRLLASENFSHIMMPFQEFCKIVLPSKAARQERIDFNIPATPPVYLAGVEEHITILPSLQKPRKVTLKGSDGKAYIIMLKPRDDLRKDYRLMEFNVVVNRFLQDAPETRRRRLYIRTYSVLPLNEECGVIEWVPNLVGLRPILLHIYKQKGIHTSNRELKEMMCAKNDPFEKKRRMYEEKLLPRHPPVFQEWFRRVFSDPYGWYQARSAYIRTTAVMSMVGYILGLGDRHGENISFDSTNGDSVHVDFNCLFNKGESFEWPERVPFRLTHNMEAAMGPLAHEGMFRKSCEAVMRALRAQTAALMSVIGPFVYDPLVSWGRARPMDCGERTNEQALQHLIHIRQRLNGLVKTKNMQLSLSLSPEGQVEHLIVEATSVVNLCQMYIGWGPFL